MTRWMGSFLYAHSQEIPLKPINAALLTAIWTLASCSAIGMELENYAFFGVNPTANGRGLKTANVVERVQLVDSGDTVEVREEEFQVDTGRINGFRIWIATRRGKDSLGNQLIDSVWMNRLDLRTIKSFRQDASGKTWLEFDRRSVKSLRITPEGKRESWKGLHTAEPYSLVGIETVLASLPLRAGDKAALPVVSGRGQELAWLRFTVLGSNPEPVPTTGGVIYKPITIVKTVLGKEVCQYWIDADENAVIRRQTLSDSGGPSTLIVRGKSVQRINVFPVEPLPSAMLKVTRQRAPRIPVPDTQK